MAEWLNDWRWWWLYVFHKRKFIDELEREYIRRSIAMRQALLDEENEYLQRHASIAPIENSMDANEM